MKEIAVNTQYGGFSISHEAVMLYAKLKGFNLYTFVNAKDETGMTNFDKEVPWDEKEEPPLGMFHYSKSKELSSEGKIEDKDYFFERDIARDDPCLIKVIKKLKNKANGKFAKLGIAKIPSNIKWEIKEYDGSEWVAEVHRTWHGKEV